MPYEGEKGKLIIAFSGCGKTYYCKHTLNWLDLDDFIFHDSATLTNLENLLNWYKYNILTNSIKIAWKLTNTPLKISYVILPTLDMKNEIISRIKKRDTQNSYYWALLEKDWKFKIADFMSIDAPKIYLKPGQYVSDVIDENGNAKPGVEVIV